MTEGEEIVAILKEVGLRRLMGSDGCECGWVQLRGFHIDRSCRKSESSLRVWPQGSDVWAPDLALIAREALKQMRAEDSYSDILVRYCEWDKDQKLQPDKRRIPVCIYCGKLRESQEAYLCDECLTENKPGMYVNSTVAQEWDFSYLQPNGLQKGTRDDECSFAPDPEPPSVQPDTNQP